MNTNTLFALTLVTAMFLPVTLVSADIISFSMNTEFSGGTPPAGSSPWMVATFDDGGGTGSVKLTLTNANLVSSEFVKGWYFNIDSSFNPNDLLFSSATTIGGNGFDLPTIHTQANGFKAGGDGLYDLLFEFSTSGAGGGSRRFGAMEIYKVTISGIAGLNAHSFKMLSFPDGGNGPFLTAAHVLSINGSNSGWVTSIIPEPSSLSVGLLLAFGLCHIRGRRA